MLRLFLFLRRLRLGRRRFFSHLLFFYLLLFLLFLIQFFLPFFLFVIDFNHSSILFFGNDKAMKSLSHILSNGRQFSENCRPFFA